MRLPQSSVAFKAILLFPLFSALAVVHVLAQEDGRLPLYSCGTGETAEEGWLQLDGVALESGPYIDLRLEQHSADGLDYRFPPPGVDSKTVFRFSHSNGPEGYLVNIRFIDRGTTYTLYSLYNPPDPSDPDDAGGATGGLIGSRDGALVSDIECGENPYEFIEYMRLSMNCDTLNPLGEAACAEYEPKRNAPLDIGRIGIVD